MLLPIANRLRVPLVVQYVVLAPVVALFAIAGGLVAAPLIAREFVCDCFADIRDAHAAASTTKGDGDGNAAS
jgi:hypothetical protein